MALIPKKSILKRTQFIDKKRIQAENARQVELDENICVIGYASKLFRDDVKALSLHRGEHLIPWQGDKSLMIDRYDVRGHLTDLSDFQTDSWNRNDTHQQSNEELRIESICDKERYLALHKDLIEEQHRQEEELKRLNEAIASDDGGYNAVGFSYGGDAEYDPMNPTEDETEKREENTPPSVPVEPDEEPDEPDEEPFIAPEELSIPKGVELPATLKTHLIIEKTAMFISNQGPQMEIIMKAKQANNPQFSFLSFEHNLNPYYKHLVKMIKSKRYRPKPLTQLDQNSGKGARRGRNNSGDSHHSDDEDENDSSGYLHPSLLGKPRAVPTPPATEAQVSTSKSEASSSTSVDTSTESMYSSSSGPVPPGYPMDPRIQALMSYMDPAALVAAGYIDPHTGMINPYLLSQLPPPPPPPPDGADPGTSMPPYMSYLDPSFMAAPPPPPPPGPSLPPHTTTVPINTTVPPPSIPPNTSIPPPPLLHGGPPPHTVASGHPGRPPPHTMASAAPDRLPPHTMASTLIERLPPHTMASTLIERMQPHTMASTLIERLPPHTRASGHPVGPPPHTMTSAPPEGLQPHTRASGHPGGPPPHIMSSAPLERLPPHTRASGHPAGPPPHIMTSAPLERLPPHTMDFDPQERLSPHTMASVPLEELPPNTEASGHPGGPPPHTTEDATSSESSKLDDVIPPPPDIQPIIDKLAKYVAKNGEDFEASVRSKADQRFEFLLPWHPFYPYFMQKKILYLKEMGKDVGELDADGFLQVKKAGPVSFSIKPKRAEEKDLERKSALPVESSSDSEEEEARERPSQPSWAPNRTSHLPFDMRERKGFIPDDRPPEDWRERYPNDDVPPADYGQMPFPMPLPDDRGRKLPIPPEELAFRNSKHKLQDRLAMAARDRMANESKERVLQMERRKKAAMFLSMIKDRPQAADVPMSSDAGSSSPTEVIDLVDDTDEFPTSSESYRHRKRHSRSTSPPSHHRRHGSPPRAFKMSRNRDTDNDGKSRVDNRSPTRKRRHLSRSPSPHRSSSLSPQYSQFRSSSPIEEIDLTDDTADMAPTDLRSKVRAMLAETRGMMFDPT